jgi:hypothetical protein
VVSVVRYMGKNSTLQRSCYGLPKNMMADPRLSYSGLGELTKTKDILAFTEVKVKLKNHTMSKKMLEAKGGASNPVTKKKIIEKFKVCAGRKLASEKVEKFIEIIFSLENVEQATTLTEALILRTFCNSKERFKLLHQAYFL